MRVYVDATALFDLGQIGDLDLLTVFEGDLVIPSAVTAELTVEPAQTNLERFLDENDVGENPDIGDYREDARQLLDAAEDTSDVALVACLLRARDQSEEAALVSDDRRLRAVADGLGATVTSTFGVVVRASVDDKYFPRSQAKRVIRRTDHHGTQMTGQLRERVVGEID